MLPNSGERRIVSRSRGLEITVPGIDGCKNRPTEVNYLEHVQLIVDMDYPKRGAIKINIRSPLGKLKILENVMNKKYVIMMRRDLMTVSPYLQEHSVTY